LLHLSKTRSKADPIPVMELLAASGANIDARDETQGTLLMYFARQGKAEPVKWLLAHGADRNARNKSGKTAAEVGRAHAAFVRLLPSRRTQVHVSRPHGPLIDPGAQELHLLLRESREAVPLGRRRHLQGRRGTAHVLDQGTTVALTGDQCGFATVAALDQRR